MQEGHPIIQVFDKTLACNFPLILFIGREANEDGDVSPNLIGSHTEIPRGVWGNAYRQVAQARRSISLTAAQLKGLVREKRSSPIVFANSCPLCIPNRITNKDRYRDEQIKTIPIHIANLFSHQNIIHRVRLVVHHGVLGTQKWTEVAVKEVMRYADKSKIPYVRTAFLSAPANQIRIGSDLSAHAATIDFILSEFEVA